MKKIVVVLSQIILLSSIVLSCSTKQRYVKFYNCETGNERFFHALDSVLSCSNNAEKDIYQVFSVIFLDEKGEELPSFDRLECYVLCFNKYCITSYDKNQYLTFYDGRWYTLPKTAVNTLISNPQKTKMLANDELFISRWTTAPMGFDNPLLYKWDPIHFTMEAIPLVPELGTLYYRICE